jgi:hypothetical protein
MPKLPSKPTPPPEPQVPQDEVAAAKERLHRLVQKSQRQPNEKSGG